MRIHMTYPQFTLAVIAAVLALPVTIKVFWTAIMMIVNYATLLV
jgi:hypothetical protein